MSSFNRQQINNPINGTQPSSIIDVNTTLAIVDPTAPTTMYSLYAALNASIDTYATDTTNLFDISRDDVFNRLDYAGNDTDGADGLQKRDHVFDRSDVRVIFTIIYSLVFCCCFFGEYVIKLR